MASRAAVASFVAIRRALKVARLPLDSAAAPEVPTKTRYSGVLAQPLSFRIWPFLQRRPHWYPGDDADWTADVEPVIAREDQAWFERLTALADWYGIELNKAPSYSDCLHLLLFELAGAHVPGFAIAEQ